MTTWLWWSSGKDSAWALQRLCDDGAEVTGLVTSVHEGDEVATHGVPGALLDAQAAALGLRLLRMPIPEPCPNEDYERALALVVDEARSAGVTEMAFGDLFLESVRDYRMAQLEGTGIAARFPLWGEPTAELAAAMQAGGLRAVLTCVDTTVLPAAFAGRSWDAELLGELPEGVDPCGENGEFHTFAWDGPMFDRPVPVRCIRRRAGRVGGRKGFTVARLRLG